MKFAIAACLVASAAGLQIPLHASKAGSILQALQNNSDFSSFVSVLNLDAMADVKKSLEADGEKTVFAPNNQAVERMKWHHAPKEEEDWVDIIKYHVVEKTVKLEKDLLLDTELTEDGLNGKAQKVKVCQFQVPKKWPPHRGNPGSPHPGPPGGVPHPPHGHPPVPPHHGKPEHGKPKHGKHGKGGKHGGKEARGFWSSLEDKLEDWKKGRKGKKPETRTLTAINCYARVQSTIKAENGVVYEVGSVLLPPGSPSAMLHHFPHVVGVLNAALEKAELETTLDEAKEITLFAPTNWAFRKLGAKRLSFLFSPKGKEALTKILSYHVVPKVVYSRDALKHAPVKVPTLLKDQYLKLDKGKLEWHGHVKQTVTVNKDAKIMFADGFLSNGVGHLLTEVLIPKKSGIDKEELFPEVDQTEAEAIASLPESIRWVFEDSEEDIKEYAMWY